MQAVAERHAARTPKQAESIRQRWKQRQDLHKYTAEQVANFMAIEKDLGIQRGLSMSHVEANQDRPNPNYMRDKTYRINCQSCVVTYELRRRGFDLETLPMSTALQDRLAYNTNLLWIDPKTGKPPVVQRAGGNIEINRRGALKPKSKKKIAADFEVMTAEQGRYHMTVVWSGGKDSHIVTCERLADGTMRIYDPQTGKLHNLQYYLDNIQTARGIAIQRVDKLVLATGKFESTPKPLTQVVKKSSTQTPRITKQGRIPKTTVLGKGDVGADNGGELITDPRRIAQANKSKQEMIKFKSEQYTCKVIVKHGHRVEHLDDTSLDDGRYDALVNGKKADIKRVSTANNIIKYASKAINKQGAEIIVFQFDNETSAIVARIEELKRKGFKFMYFFTGKEDVLYDFT